MSDKHGEIKFLASDDRIVTIIATWLTPQQAAELLKLNTRNRPMRKSRADEITRDIRSGNWDFTGETIKFASDENGLCFLCDAQHRLQAIADGDRAVPVIIVMNLDPKATSRIDQNLRRSIGDILRMKYEQNHVKNAAIVSAISLLALESRGQINPTRDEVADHANRNIAEFSEWAAWAKAISRDTDQVKFGSNRSGSAMTPAPLAVLAMHMIDCGADADLTTEFFRRIATGQVADSDESNVIPALRKRQKNGIPLSRAGGGGSSLQPLLTEFATYIMAYNRWVDGERVDVIKGQKTPVKSIFDLPTVSKSVSI